MNPRKRISGGENSNQKNANPSGIDLGFVDAVALTPKALAATSDRDGQNDFALWGHSESSKAQLELREATKRFKKQLALAGMPRTFGPKLRAKWDALRRDPRKRKMAEIALSAWKALNAMERHVKKWQWAFALKQAFHFACCVGRLEEKNQIGSPHKIEGSQSMKQEWLKLIDAALLESVDCLKHRKEKFDTQTVEKYEKTHRFKKLSAGRQATELSTWRKSLPPWADLKTPAGRGKLAKNLSRWRFQRRYPLAGFRTN